VYTHTEREREGEGEREGEKGTIVMKHFLGKGFGRSWSMLGYDEAKTRNTQEKNVSGSLLGNAV
jgi:hypothetical protein